MKRIQFFGTGDDTVEITGDLGEHEFRLNDEIAVFHLDSAAAHQRLAVIAVYSPDQMSGTWCFGVGQVEEDDVPPPWSTRFAAKHAYSIALEIDVPDDTTASYVDDDDAADADVGAADAPD